MAINNPYIPGDPFSYDLKWIIKKLKEHSTILSTLDQTISEKIVQLLDQHDPVYWDSAATLISSDMKAPSLAYIEGYYEAGDGGANLYYITSDYNDVLVADFYLTLDGANRWAIPVITTPYVTPEMFGAYGDGTTDDGDAFEIACKYPLVYMKNTYMLKRPISIADGTNVYIAGKINHEMDASYSYVGVFTLEGNNLIEGGTFDGGGTLSHYNKAVTVIYAKNKSNITIRNATAVNTPYWAVFLLESCTNSVIEDCTVDEYTHTGISFVQGCKHCTIKGCKVINGNETVDANRYPISGSAYYGSQGYPTAEDIHILNNYVEDASPYWEGIDFHGSSGAVIEGNVIKGTYTGIAIVGDPDYTNSNVLINNNQIELATTGALSARNNVGIISTRVTNINIHSNIIKNAGVLLPTDELSGSAVRIAYGKNVTIMSNIMQNCRGDGVSCYELTDADICDNQIEGSNEATPKTFEAEGSCDRLIIHDNTVTKFLRALYGPDGGDYSVRNYFYNNRYDGSVSYSSLLHIVLDKTTAGFIPNMRSAEVGDYIFNASAATGSPSGWICTSAGAGSTAATWAAISTL